MDLILCCLLFFFSLAVPFPNNMNLFTCKWTLDNIYISQLISYFSINSKELRQLILRGIRAPNPALKYMKRPFEWQKWPAPAPQVASHWSQPLVCSLLGRLWKTLASGLFALTVNKPPGFVVHAWKSVGVIIRVKPYDLVKKALRFRLRLRYLR